MKPSRYNYFVEWKGFRYGCNLMYGYRIFLRPEQYELLENYPGDERMKTLDKGLYEMLVKTGCLIDPDIDEYAVMKFRHERSVYSDEGVYDLTVMPTLDCNLRCWYCYEEHVPSRMSEEIIDRTVKFVAGIIGTGTIRHFRLGWFGGEPFMYFDEAVYPLSSRIKALTDSAGIGFANSATTNGVLLDAERVQKCAEIGLDHFQITVDGNREHHDSSRVGRDRRGTYDRIVRNIDYIISGMENSTVSVRINYTSSTFDGIREMIDDMPRSPRVSFAFQRVWQDGGDFRESDPALERVKEYIEQRGNIYEKKRFSFGRGHICYADVLNQIIVSYDGKLFKCTARDFACGDSAVGYLDEEGMAHYNASFYKRFSGIPFDNPSCRECRILPICLGICSQKYVEDFPVTDYCNKELKIGGLEEQLYDGLLEYLHTHLEDNT